jgi:anti-anti-sigma factor
MPMRERPANIGLWLTCGGLVILAAHHLVAVRWSENPENPLVRQPLVRQPLVRESSLARAALWPRSRNLNPSIRRSLNPQWSQLVKVDTHLHGSVSVLVPHGPLAGDELDTFRPELEAAINQKSGRVVLDMSRVAYLDSAGIETLLDLCTGRQPTAARPRLAQLGETSREALDLTNVLPRLMVFDTVENAIRSYKR